MGKVSQESRLAVVGLSVMLDYELALPIVVDGTPVGWVR
jgi:hypothetical protein